MRCRISPDGSRLVICTTGGYLIIIHNLDLTKLEEDLKGFRVSYVIIVFILSITAFYFNFSIIQNYCYKIDLNYLNNKAKNNNFIIAV